MSDSCSVTDASKMANANISDQKANVTREKKAFRKLANQLIDEFELESVADQILVERVANVLDSHCPS